MKFKAKWELNGLSMELEEFRSGLAKLGFNEAQIESLSRPPIYVGQTHDPSADDYVSEGTLEYMGAIRVASGSL
jgi:hypothetical protein